MGFQDILSKIEAQDGTKTAAQRGGNSNGRSGEPDEMLKTAAFYEDVGRQLAHQVFGDIVEQSVETEHQAKVATVLDRMSKDKSYAAELVRKHGASVGIR